MLTIGNDEMAQLGCIMAGDRDGWVFAIRRDCSPMNGTTCDDLCAYEVIREDKQAC